MYSLYNLKRAIREDPGIISAISKEEKIAISLARKNELNTRTFCVTCQIRKPLRSKHCKICDVCISRFDHHCPWTMNCIGSGNHIFFIKYLTSLLFATISWYDLAWQRSHVKHVKIFMFISILPSFFVIFMTIFQLYQILINQTSNEKVNYYRLEHFFQEDEVCTEGDDDKIHNHRKFRNPFDRGMILNCREFFGLNGSNPWHRLYKISDISELKGEII